MFHSEHCVLSSIEPPTPTTPSSAFLTCVSEAASFPRKLAFCPSLAPIHILSQPFAFRAGQPAEAEAQRETLLRVIHLIICCTNMCFACLTVARGSTSTWGFFFCLWSTDILRNTKFWVSWLLSWCFCNSRVTCDFLLFVWLNPPSVCATNKTNCTPAK